MAAAFATLFAIAPPALVAVSPGLEAGSFVCEVEIEAPLAVTLEGKLEFLLVRGLQGRRPAERFVVTIDHGYTAGVDENSGDSGEPRTSLDPVLAPGGRLWLEGSLMGRDTYFGEQYLFFGYPQLYLGQVKTGVFWPSQHERLVALYPAPFTAVASVYLVWAYPFMEEYSLASWLLIAARFLLICTAVAAALILRKRGVLRREDDRRRGLVWVVGLYVLLAVVLAAVGL